LVVLSDLIDLEQLDVAASKSVAFIAADLARGNLQEQISPRWDVTREAAAQMLAVRQMQTGYSDPSGGRGRGVGKYLLQCRLCDFEIPQHEASARGAE